MQDVRFCGHDEFTVTGDFFSSLLSFYPNLSGNPVKRFFPRLIAFFFAHFVYGRAYTSAGYVLCGRRLYVSVCPR
jgi:hypothetical protein